MHPISAAILIAATGAVLPLSASASASASAAAQRALESRFVCPEKLADDAARLDAVTRFMQDYARIDPNATVNDRLAARDRLLARHKCAPDDGTAHYSFPQT